MNNLTSLLGIHYPIIQGGMGNISNAGLSAAVSEAGGLGTIGVGTMNPFQVEEMIKEAKSRTSKPIAMNIPIVVNSYVKEILKLVFQYEIPIVSLSAGNPAPFIPLLHEHGVKVMVVIGAVSHAIKAEQAGADILVAEGVEAAGINSPFETTTLSLVPQVVDATKIPVVAAGGVGDGRGLLAALSLGAQGVQMGTRFIATQEAPFSQEYKRRILNANDHSTIIIGRSIGKIRRVLDGEYATSLLKNEKNLTIPQYNEATSEAHHIIGALDGNEKRGFMNSGQIAGLIQNQPTVKELLDEMMFGCRNQLENIGNILE